MAGLILPQIVTSTDGKEHSTDLVSYDLIKNRVVYLNGEITSELTLSIITQLRYLAAKSDDEIYLIINSPGGSVGAFIIKLFNLSIHRFLKKIT